MGRAADLGALLRFVAGTAASVLAGLAIFRLETFEPRGPWFQCVTAGAMVAGVVALMRVGRPAQALSLAAAFTLVHMGYAFTLNLGSALAESLSSLALGGGAFVSAVIFDRLAVQGYRFGKFALLGPLVAGVYLAATMLAVAGPDRGGDVMGVLVRYVVVGLVIGDAVGLGIELVELLPGVRTPPARVAGLP